jgi:hypothetical protein
MGRAAVDENPVYTKLLLLIANPGKSHSLYQIKEQLREDYKTIVQLTTLINRMNNLLELELITKTKRHGVSAIRKGQRGGSDSQYEIDAGGCLFYIRRTVLDTLFNNIREESDDNDDQYLLDLVSDFVRKCSKEAINVSIHELFELFVASVAEKWYSSAHMTNLKTYRNHAFDVNIPSSSKLLGFLAECKNYWFKNPTNKIKYNAYEALEFSNKDDFKKRMKHSKTPKKVTSARSNIKKVFGH